MKKPRIETTQTWPLGGPRPFWVAWDDNLGADTSPYGYGQSEDDAIADLERQLEEMEE